MAITTETQWRQLVTCDLCGTQDVFEAAWAIDHAPHYPAGWARFRNLYVTQVNSVDRYARELDFCPQCLHDSGLRTVIDRIPLDERQNVIKAREQAGW